MYIIGVDPGLQTGVALLDIETGMIDGWVDDSRGHNKERVAQNVIATVQQAIYNTPPKANIQVVVEDFVLRYGQAAGGKYLRPYLCSCGNYHLTSQKRKNQ